MQIEKSKDKMLNLKNSQIETLRLGSVLDSATCSKIKPWTSIFSLEHTLTISLKLTVTNIQMHSSVRLSFANTYMNIPCQIHPMKSLQVYPGNTICYSPLNNICSIIRWIMTVIYHASCVPFPPKVRFCINFKHNHHAFFIFP